MTNQKTDLALDHHPMPHLPIQVKHSTPRIRTADTKSKRCDSYAREGYTLQPLGFTKKSPLTTVSEMNSSDLKLQPSGAEELEYFKDLPDFNFLDGDKAP